MHKAICLRLAATFFGAAGLISCQTTSNNVGQGPRPALSGEVAKFFEEYKSIPGANKSFAVSVSGQAAGASHCSTGRYGHAASSLDEGRCNTEFAALNYCRTKSAGSPCFIYAWGNDIVWGSSDKSPQTLAAAPQKEITPTTTKNTQIRKFVAIWEGVPGPVTGEIKAEADSGTAAVSLSISNNMFCEGLATFGKNGNGNWVLRCKDELIMSGTLRELGQNGTILGTGKDSKGRKISFSVASI